MSRDLPIVPTRPELEFVDVSFRYPRREALVLQKVNLAVGPGERVGIVGSNGSGKSTIAKLLLGIYPPQGGEVRLFGKPVAWTRHYPDLGYIGDPGHNAEELGLPSDVTVEQMLHTLGDLYGVDDKRSLLDISAELGLSPLLPNSVRTLSTGERKRLMATLAFAKHPRLVILDEPADGLDEDIQPVMERLIRELVEAEGRTVLYIAHNPVEIDSFTDTVYRLHKGRLLPQPQSWFRTEVSRQGTTEQFRYKSGQVQGLVQRLIKSESDFHIHVEPD